MANVPKAITDLPVASAMGDDDLLVVSQNATTSSIKGELIKGYAQNAVASQVTAAQTAANQAGQSATQAEAARQGAAAAQTAAENAQDVAETARDQSVAAAGTIGDSVEQAQTAAGQASSAKDAAVAAQTAAETAKTAAETASGQAQTAATQASGSATTAQTAATQAGDAKTDAETARNEAETSASSAANSASDAESAATEAEQAKTYIENMNMEGETLPAGSSVTVTKTTSPEGNLLFVIGVPQGIQGDKGDPGETGATGPQGVSITNATVNEDGDLVITLSAGGPINAGSVIGPQGEQGEVGPTGASVDHIDRTSGTGAPGTTDTYTVYLTDGKTGGTFQVYNGSNGAGAGDFMADGSVPMTGDLQMGGNKITNLAEPTDNTDAASKEYVDDTITVSLVGNYIPTGQKGQANGVASLDGSGKVPSAQLPPMDYVPTSRTVNGHALSADVTLDADDVGAIPNPTGGTAGQVLTKTADGSAWEDTPSGLPDGGAEGQMLYKSADGAAWGDKPVMIVNATDSEDASLTTDKTLDEIKEAYLNDVNISIKYMDSLFPLVFAKNVTGENPSFRFLNHSTNIVSGGPSLLAEAEIRIFRTQGEDFAYFYVRSGGLVPTDGNQGETLYYDNVGVSHWGPAPKGIPSGGTPGQVLTKASTGEEWSDAPSGLPEGGTEGQILEKTSSGAAWVDAPESGLTQEQADERYLQLTGGTVTGEVTVNDWFYVKSGAISVNPSPLKNTAGINSDEIATKKIYRRGGVGYPNLSFSGNNIRLYNNDGNGASVSVGPTGDLNGSQVKISGDYVYISNLVDPTDPDDATNKAYVDSKAPTSVTVTLTADGWTNTMAPVEPGGETLGHRQTVTVSGVSATETAQLITPTPAIASQSAYYEAGIMCTGQAANSLTFTCQTVPTSNLTVYVIIQPLS